YFRTEVIGSGSAFPFRRETEAGGEMLIGANHGAPEVTFEVDSGREFFGSGIITIQHVEIEEAIVVEIDETSAPGPSGVIHRHGWGLPSGDLLEFTVGLFVV